MPSRLIRQELLENGTGAVRLQGFPPEALSINIARNALWTLTRQIRTPVSKSGQGQPIFSVRDAGFSAEDSRGFSTSTLVYQPDEALDYGNVPDGFGNCLPKG